MTPARQIQDLQEPAHRTGWGVLVDDLGTQERAILLAPASRVSTELMNHLLSLSRGLTFVAMSAERAHAFLLEPMTRPPQPPTDGVEPLPLLVSVEAREGITTGISAADRARTVRLLAESIPNPRALVRPGHIFPVQTARGGILAEPSRSTAASTLSRIWWSDETALFLDILDERGQFLDPSGSLRLADQYGAPCVTLSALLRHCLCEDTLITRVATAALPTRLGGELTVHAYRSTTSATEHLALTCGCLSGDEPVLTRVQTSSLCADVFGGLRSPARRRLEQSLSLIKERGRGVVLYLRSADEGMALGSQGRPAEHSSTIQTIRHHGIGAHILRDLGIHRIELLTSGRKSLPGLAEFGIEIASQRILAV